MIRRMFPATAMVLALCFQIDPSSAADIAGYRSLNLGMSIEQAEKKLAGSKDLIRCKPLPKRVSGCLQFIEPGTPDRKVIVFFRKNKAYLIRLLPQIDKRQTNEQRCDDLYETTRATMAKTYGKPDIVEEFKKFGSLIKRSVWLDKTRHLRVSGSWMESAKFCTGVMVDFRDRPYKKDR